MFQNERALHILDMREQRKRNLNEELIYPQNPIFDDLFKKTE